MSTSDWILMITAAAAFDAVFMAFLLWIEFFRVQEHYERRLSDEKEYAQAWRKDCYRIAKAHDDLLADYQRLIDREMA